jgi:hypothetical protein
MTMNEGPRHSDEMVMRIPAGTPMKTIITKSDLRPKFDITITARNGAELVHMTEDDDGHLVITGDESRWDEGAKRFLHAMMQWSGEVGIRWKDEAKKAAEQ